MKVHSQNASMPPLASARQHGIRINRQMVAILALTFLALSLPITMLSIAIVKATKHPRQLDNQTAPENSGLRNILEKVANEKLTPAALTDDRGQYVLFEKPDKRFQIRKRIENTVVSLGGKIVNNTGQDSITVLIPTEAANRFQTAELSNAKMLSEPSLKTPTIIYLIRFEQ